MNINPNNISIRENGLGAYLHQFNLAKEVQTPDIEVIKTLLCRHRLVIFSNQDLSDEALNNFAGKLGPPFVPDKNFPVLGSGNEKSSVIIVGNQATEYTHAYLGHQEVLPHSDHQWLPQPSSASMLYALDIEPGSAPTQWIDMVSAYNTLDNKIKTQIDKLRLITYNPFYRPFGSVSARYVSSELDRPPGEAISHPLVRTHPESGDKILYLHQAYEMELEEISYERGKAIIGTLQEHINQTPYRYEHHWKPGDLVLWDNRATLHYRPAFEK